MDLSEFISIPGEKPLDRLPADGGLTNIFRTIGCIGDSLSSGEFEIVDEQGQHGYHDYFEYSFGQYIARATGAKVFNFSRGGMTAMDIIGEFSNLNHFWDRGNACQAYILALGVNDVRYCPLGTLSDIDFSDWRKCRRDTFAGAYGSIILRLREQESRTKFFPVTIPGGEGKEPEKWAEKTAAHAAILRGIEEKLDNVYVIDLLQYAPEEDEEFRRNFSLNGHRSPAGYYLTARMIMGYIDFIIRNHPEEFREAGLIGTPYGTGRLI
ncbi:MAG: SGNH/GDSL hydrolase family protein [Lachnospiraceae bacterium]|jgi:hypothetical protein|nr:SGNH/GDSL hydrolase family protein [Lachnospiraceae bacterium]